MLGRKILIELQEYVDSYLEVKIIDVQEANKYMSEDILHKDLEVFVNTNRELTFAQVLFNFIDKKEHTDVEVYKKARIDRKLFSKIRSNPDYRIGKSNAIALALALELNKKETEELLRSAGFSLSKSNTFDLVIQFCLEKEIYDLDEVNQALDYCSLKSIN